MAPNDGFEYREQIGPREEGRTLLDHMAARHRHSTRAQWQARIEGGELRIDGEVATAEARLVRGQHVLWRRAGWEEPEAPLNYGLLWEEGDLLAVDKPSGLPTLPGGGFLEHTLLHLVRQRFPTASPLHRLGRFTSGIVLFACSPGSRAALSQQWGSREVHKRYRALAVGRPVREEFEVSVPIGPVDHALLGRVHAASPSGRSAESRVAVVEQREAAFLADVWIATGRPHQIRIHLAAAGHPLVGDPLYGPGGGPLPGTRALPGDPGYQLHAAALGFRHPDTGREIRIDCPPPPLLRVG